MGKIITIAHQKGGVGKSTMAINLSLCFKDQLKVILIDSDLQGSIYQIKDDFPGLEIVQADDVKKIASLTHDLIIIDTPPYLSNKLNDLFSISDMVIVPTKAGFFDVMAIRATLLLIKFAQAQNSSLKQAVVLNMVKPRTSLTKEVTDLLKGLGTKILDTQIHDRVSITRSSVTGGVLGGEDEKAKQEYIALAEEIVDLLGA